MESVVAQPEVWETPEFEQIEVAPEVTMYFGRLD
ncbi:coenzyme PQQ precursor peptide PqqA [Lipingzhangella halophila]|uniref:Coenzyme PQQ synthesis protein A n=1 Tax=Lipingzhangella halophila TaxID=1783352 RepID=A0A7W7RI17_9ACTN|nr:pyrroloquinoline quinone precursor peptide PqqA [Lipingzhangella halophila]MBB4932344.1 coenzyme PQQ precursor peptide PqqA [Lipingzhangella halophila]